jgi:hypothetical protein
LAQVDTLTRKIDSIPGNLQNVPTEIAGQDTLTPATNPLPAVETSIDLQQPQVKLLKPMDKVDSLFRVLEKKEEAIKKIQRQQSQSQSTTEAQKPQKIELPGSFLTDSSYLTDGLLQSFNADNHAILDQPVYSTLNTSEPAAPEIQTKDFKNILPSDFILGFALASILTLIVLKTLFGHFFNNYFRMAMNQQLTNKMFRDRNVFTARFNFTLNMVYVTTASLFVFQVFHYFNFIGEIRKIHFFYILLSIAGIALARYLVLKLVGEVFQVRKRFSEYSFNVFMFNKLMGIAMVPLVIGIQYVPAYLKPMLVYTGIIMVAVLFIMKLVRGLQLIIKKDVLLFYAILYLCAIEILPVLVGITFIRRFF